MAQLALVAFVLAASLAPSPLAAQFTEPCQLRCAAVLGVTGFVAATGTSVAVGRMTGGMSTSRQGIVVWASTFALAAGGGIALSGSGQRQERAIYAAALGTAAGALTGLAFEAVRSGGDEPRMLAGTLVGAAVGALIGGVYGALSHDSDDPRDPVQLFSVGLSF